MRADNHSGFCLHTWQTHRKLLAPLSLQHQVASRQNAARTTQLTCWPVPHLRSPSQGVAGVHGYIQLLYVALSAAASLLISASSRPSVCFCYALMAFAFRACPLGIDLLPASLTAVSLPGSHGLDSTKCV